MAEPAGCIIESLEATKCRDLLDWIRGSAEPSIQDVESQPDLLLAYCYDGVTWGRLDREAGRWQLACEPFPAQVPKPKEENLLELRLFGRKSEILIWRHGHTFCGRILRDGSTSVDYLCPIDESRILLGDRLLEAPKDGFSRVGTPTGAEQIVPVTVSEEIFQQSPWPLRLWVRHYLECEGEAGAVRIAATRLVSLEVKRK
ncbi:MAG: CRISPR-associated protein Csx19 [Bryobacteraceae bacterium]|nr:CRISPR-associated protein Csx19 [Bryobacteraceae bacterium]MDW8380472.1 CRISPR-associated protein Csx19 [Bryobacterales bacterium]